MNATRSALPLSKREWEVARLVADGHSNREIAKRLFISERTAEYHLESIRSKLGFHSRTQIAVWIAERGSEPQAITAPTPVVQAGRPRSSPHQTANRSHPRARRLVLPLAGAVTLLVIWSGIQFDSLLRDRSPQTEILAGVGTRGFSGDGGKAVGAQLTQPSGIAVEPGGAIVFLDGDRVRRIGIDGVISTVAGTGTNGYSGDGLAATLADLNLRVFPVSIPEGIAVDGSGNIYIADYDNHRVRRVAPSQTITTVAGTGTPGWRGDDGPAVEARLWYPRGLAFDRAGNLYIADSANNRVRVVDGNGNIRTVAGSGESGWSGDGGPALAARLDDPTGLAVDPAGNLYIADTGNHRIRRVGLDGSIATIAGTGQPGLGGDGGAARRARLNVPVAVAVDDRGDIFVADSENNRVRRIDAAGTITTLATGLPLDHPSGVAVDVHGEVLVADANHNRILRLHP